MFDLQATKLKILEDDKKRGLNQYPAAIRAIPAIPEAKAPQFTPENSTNSTNSTYPPAETSFLINRLRRIAIDKNHPLDDLLDWFKDDMEDLARKAGNDLDYIISDYISKQSVYLKTVPHCVKCVRCRHFVRLDRA